MNWYRLGILFISSVCCAKTSQELFLQANEYAIDGAYDKAVELYEQIPEKSLMVWYNLAQVAVKQERLVQALVYLKRVQNRAGLDMVRVIHEQITQLQNRLKLSVDERLPVSCYVRAMTNSVPWYLAQLLIIAGLILSLFCVSWAIQHKKYWSAGSILIGLGMISSGVVMQYRWQSSTYAVASTAQSVRVMPNDCMSICAQLAAGQTVTVQKIQDEWAKIACDDIIGWVSCQQLEHI